MRTNEARDIAAEDHSLSRFMGSKRAMGEDIEQLADLVYTDKRQQGCYSVLINELVAYWKMDPKTQQARNKCNRLGCGAVSCGCTGGKLQPCNCECIKNSGNTKLAK